MMARDDQLIENLRARTWPGDCEAAAFLIEELLARVAELEAERDELVRVLQFSRLHIEQERQEVLGCHFNPASGLVDKYGTEALAAYDRVLTDIDAAMQPPKGES